MTKDNYRIKHIMEEVDYWKGINEQKEEVRNLELDSLKDIFFKGGNNYEEKLLVTCRKSDFVRR